MEGLTTAQAASRVGVSVTHFERLAVRHGVKPVLKAPGIRGAKFWHRLDVDRIAERLTETRAS